MEIVKERYMDTRDTERDIYSYIFFLIRDLIVLSASRFSRKLPFSCCTFTAVKN